MGEFFHTVLYEPLFNLLIYIYHYLPFKDLGIAIIILTLIIKLLLFYPSMKALRAQKDLQDMQPKLSEIKEKYKDDKEELGRQIMAFYKEHKVNPFSSCLPLLIQLPILWALFQVFFGGLKTDPTTGLLAADQVQNIYGHLQAVYYTTPIDHTFLGFVDLAKTHNIVLAVIAGVLQYLQAKMLQSKRPPLKSEGAKDEDMAAALNKQMLYFFPIITVIFGYQFPAGVTLYWLSSTLFTWIQQLVFLRDKKEEAPAVEVVDSVPKQK